MLDVLIDGLAWLHQWSDPLAWLVVALFLAGSILEWRGREEARVTLAVTWGLFAVFWLSLLHYYAIDQKSFVEGLGALIAVPGAVYVGYLLYDGRDSLFVLSRAIAVMGLVFLPFEAIPLFKQTLVEAVTRQTEWLMMLLGFDPTVISGDAAVLGGADSPYDPYRNTFYFVGESGHELTYTIRIACTGIGSIAIFAGLVAAVPGSLRRKLRALAVSVPVIYGLNLIRNVFIGLSFGHQYLHVFPDVIMGLFASDDPYMVSFFVADRILAQSLSVVALVAITWLVVRELPDVLIVVDDVLYLLTGSEYHLQETLDVTPVRTDGDG